MDKKPREKIREGLELITEGLLEETSCLWDILENSELSEEELEFIEESIKEYRMGRIKYYLNEVNSYNCSKKELLNARYQSLQERIGIK